MRAEFDESLVTGNEMIDTQHRELIDKINKLLDSCETSRDKVVAVKTLDYLADDRIASGCPGCSGCAGQ